MEIKKLVWTSKTVEKIVRKHHLYQREVEEVFFESEAPLHIRRSGRLYHAYGRSAAGRYLFVVLLVVGRGRAQVVTARDMTQTERRLYRKETER